MEETPVPSAAMDITEAGGTGTEENASPSTPGTSSDVRMGSQTSKMRDDHPKVRIPPECFLWLLIWVVHGVS